MKILFALISLCITIPVSAKPHCEHMKTVPDGEYLCKQLEKVIETYLPGARNDSKWKIVIVDRREAEKEDTEQANFCATCTREFPPRCWTYVKRHETHCNGPWVREFSMRAKAGTMAHEYGHILCDGPEQGEKCADTAAIKVLNP